MSRIRAAICASYAEYMRNQVTELLTNYGKIDILWFDFSYSGQRSPGKDPVDAAARARTTGRRKS